MAAALFIAFVILLVIGAPIAIALGGAAFVSIAGFSDIPLILVPQRFFTGADSFTLMAIPFFMISGALMTKGGVSSRLINLFGVILRKLPGGLAIVVCVASAFFGAISGSSPATAAAIGGIMLPAMMAAKYNQAFSMSCVASAGYLGSIIPPSIIMVTYGVAVNASIGDMFMAGLIPGIMLCLGMCVYSYLVGKKNNYVLTETHTVTGKEFLKLLVDAIPAILMPLIILGGIYGGIFTPTEAGCVSVIYGLIVGFFVYKELKIKDLFVIFKESALSTSMILFIIAGAAAFGNIMTREMVPNTVANFLISLTDNKIVYLLLVNVLLLIVGCFMETNVSILILAPILFPVAQSMGVDIIHFGIIMVVNLSIGTLTPPLGMNLYVASGIMKTKVTKMLGKHLVGFIFVSVAVLMLITYIPEISTFLPRLFAD